MGGFTGGSAWSAARDVASGVMAVNERSLSRLTRPELDQLTFELDRLLREVRAEQPTAKDHELIRNRNRILQRINGALMVVRGIRARIKG